MSQLTPITPYSYTSLANRAIAKLGGLRNAPQIADIDDTANAVAVQVKSLIGPVRKEVLAAPPAFKESIRYAALGSPLENTVERADWQYAFNVPSDCLRVITQTSQTNRNASFEHERIGGYLLTNTLSDIDEETAYIKYVFDLAEAEKFSPLLFETVATKLAAEIAMHLGNQGQMRQALLQEYDQMVRRRAMEANQGDGYDVKDEMGNTDWLDARFR